MKLLQTTCAAAVSAASIAQSRRRDNVPAFSRRQTDGCRMRGSRDQRACRVSVSRQRGCCDPGAFCVSRATQPSALLHRRRVGVNRRPWRRFPPRPRAPPHAPHPAAIGCTPGSPPHPRFPSRGACRRAAAAPPPRPLLDPPPPTYVRRRAVCANALQTPMPTRFPRRARPHVRLPAVCGPLTVPPLSDAAAPPP